MDDDKKIEKKEFSNISQASEFYKGKNEKIEDIKKIEKQEVLEKTVESSLENRRENSLEKKKTGEQLSTPDAGNIGLKGREEAIENTLESGLEEIYMNMPAEKRLEFKRVGEETARKICNLMNQTKINAKKIVNLIKKWLSLVPGINKFFLEQEAKIKTDQILKLKV